MSIELVNVSKAFGETQVLRGLSERFAQGEAVCVMGRSGLGKTTLARIVMGLEKPDAGAVRGAKGKRFAAAFQEDRLVERLSAQGNLRFACGAALDEPRMAEAFAAVGLTPQDVEKPSFPAGSGGVWRCCGPCWLRRTWWCWTNRSRAWTKPRGRRPPHMCGVCRPGARCCASPTRRATRRCWARGCSACRRRRNSRKDDKKRAEAVINGFGPFNVWTTKFLNLSERCGTRRQARK